jgi:hypothetical protein
MSRKPISTLAGGKSPRQRIWENIRQASNGFTLFDVCYGDIPIETARDFLNGLERAGVLGVAAPTGRGERKRYNLLVDRGIEAPRVRRDGTEVVQGHVNEGMWGAIKVLDSFTAQTIADLAGAAPGAAKSYCMFLARAGYLDVASQGKGHGNGGTASIYRTNKSRITGPRAPMITRLKAVYDPNIHQVVWMQGADDAILEADHETH